MTRKRIIISAVSLLMISMLCVIAIRPVRHGVRTAVTTIAARMSPAADAQFPAIDSSKLTEQQLDIITLARQEYQNHPVSYDQNVLKYTGGNKEAWCADFISWVMIKTGNSYKNPNSGSWRIPGVYTLQEFYKAQKKYVGTEMYGPKVGDVAFYIGRHTFDIFSTEHVSLVVAVNGDMMTTIGGNEGGKLRLDTQRISADSNSLVGFGRL